jgi:hypothetical protein
MRAVPHTYVPHTTFTFSLFVHPLRGVGLRGSVHSARIQPHLTHYVPPDFIYPGCTAFFLRHHIYFIHKEDA